MTLSFKVSNFKIMAIPAECLIYMQCKWGIEFKCSSKIVTLKLTLQFQFAVKMCQNILKEVGLLAFLLILSCQILITKYRNSVNAVKNQIFMSCHLVAVNLVKQIW